MEKKDEIVEISSLSDYIKEFEEIMDFKDKEVPKNVPENERDENKKLERKIKGAQIFRGEPGEFDKRIAGAFRDDYIEENKSYEPTYYRNFMNNVDEYYREISHRLTEIERNDFIAFSQHHGLPTNFIDVTQSPLIALFFACDTAEKKDVAYVYMFEDYIDVTDIIVNYPKDTVVDLLANGKTDVMNDLHDLLWKYQRRLIRSNKMDDYLKNVLLNIYESTKDTTDENGVGIFNNLFNIFGVIHNVTDKICEEIKQGKTVPKLEENLKELFENITDHKFGIKLSKEQHEVYYINPYRRNNPIIFYYVVFLCFYLSLEKYQPIKNRENEFMPCMVYRPKTSFQRSRLQQAFFIVQPFFEKKNRYSEGSKIHLLQDITHSKSIKINNPKQILQQLNYIGINRGTVYGDFDNIAKHIKEKSQ